MNCSPPSSSVHGDSSGQNTGVGCHSLLQRIFPAQGSNSGLLHCRQILYHLSYKESQIFKKPYIKLSYLIFILLPGEVICSNAGFTRWHDTCLENSMERGAWQATVHGVIKSQTRLSNEAAAAVWTLNSTYFITSH